MQYAVRSTIVFHCKHILSIYATSYMMHFWLKLESINYHLTYKLALIAYWLTLVDRDFKAEEYHILQPKCCISIYICRINLLTPVSKNTWVDYCPAGGSKKVSASTVHVTEILGIFCGLHWGFNNLLRKTCLSFC